MKELRTALELLIGNSFYASSYSVKLDGFLSFDIVYLYVHSNNFCIWQLFFFHSLSKVRHILPHLTWDNLCANMSIFEHIFDTKQLGINSTHIHNIVCNKVLLETNFTALEEDLNQNVEGFSAYIHNVSFLIDIYIYEHFVTPNCY